MGRYVHVVVLVNFRHVITLPERPSLAGRGASVIDVMICIHNTGFVGCCLIKSPVNFLTRHEADCDGIGGGGEVDALFTRSGLLIIFGFKH